MQDELPIGSYLRTLARRWWFVALVLAISLIVAVVTTGSTKAMYVAKAGVVVVRSVTEVNLDAKIKTNPDAPLGGITADARTSRLQTLAELVSNSAVEAKVVSKLGAELPEALRKPGKLMPLVQGSASGPGEIITIRVNSDNPGRAASIANTWGQAYAEYVNQLYGGGITESNMQGQVGEALQSYRKAVDELARFQSSNQLTVLGILIADRQNALKQFQAARTIAASDVISNSVKAQSRLATEYNSALVGNRLMAFRAEQDAKAKLFSSYLDAIGTARKGVFDKQLADSVRMLSDDYAQKARVEGLLADARSFLAQVNQGGSTGGATAVLPLLLLKAQAFASSASAGSAGAAAFQISLDGATATSIEAPQLRRELESLIKVLESRKADLESAISAKSAELTANSGYNISPSLLSNGDAFFNQVKDSYPELFKLGELALLTQKDVDGTPLGKEATAANERLLQTQKQQLGDDLTAQPVYQDLVASVEGLQKWQEQHEQQSSTQRELQTAKDVAWDKYVALARKGAEVDVTNQSGNTLVRFSMPAVEPGEPAADDRFRGLGQAAAIGLLVGVVGAFGIDYLGRPRRKA